MDKIIIEATARTPKFDFNPETRTLTISGESYPEDPTKFFAEPMAKVYEFLKLSHSEIIRFSFHLTYFNSSSAKVLMNLFTALEDSASSGNQVQIDWNYAEDDDNMKELGEEFSEELEHAKFNMVSFV